MLHLALNWHTQKNLALYSALNGVAVGEELTIGDAFGAALGVELKLGDALGAPLSLAIAVAVLATVAVSATVATVSYTHLTLPTICSV